MSADLVLSPDFLERWRAAGLGGELAEILELHHVAVGRLREQEEADRASEARAFKDRQKSLARHAAVKAPVASPAEIIRRDFRVAYAELIRGTVRALKDLGDRPILAELQPAHRALLAEAAPLAELCDGLRTDAEVMRPAITAQAREAWVRLADLHERLAALRELLLTLVADRIVPVLQRRYEGREYRSEMFPERRPALGNRFGRIMLDPRAPAPSPSWLMTETVLDRHKVVPALLTAAEVLECQQQAQSEAWTRGEAQEREAQAEAEAARAARRDSPSAGQRAVELRNLRERHQYEQAQRDAAFMERAASRPVPPPAALPLHLEHLRSGMPTTTR